MSSIGDLSLADMLAHVAQQPVDAKRIKGLNLSTYITGQVGSGATIVAGSGWTVSSGGTGLYTITFTTAFAANPTVMVTAIFSGNQRVVNILNLGTGSVDVSVRNDAGSLVNNDFHFVAHTTV